MISKPMSTTIALLPSTPLTNGGSLDLANGQIGLFLQGARTARGVKAISNVSNLGAKDKVFLQVGTGSKGNRGSLTTRNLSTVEFHPEDVLDISFKRAEKRTVSKVVIGYDGQNPQSNISLKPGQQTSITVQLTGDPLALYGLKEGKWRQTYSFDAPHPDECEEVDVCSPVAMKAKIEALVKTIQNTQIREGLKVKDFLKVHPVFSDDAPVPTASATFYTLTVLDNGDDTALGLIQATVPAGTTVVRIERTGITSVYQVISTSGAPSAYTPYAPSVLTNCGDCPADYTEQAGGFLYYLTVEDDGADVSGNLNGVITGVTPTTPYTGVDGTYNGVAATGGSGSGATFNVVVADSGANLTIIQVNAGSGYAVGDTLTIAGTALGGATPANDLVLTVSSAIEAGSVTKIGQIHGVGTYAAVYEANPTDAQKEILIANNPTIKISFEGEVDSICTPDNPASSTDWVEGEECGLITETYFIDVPNTDCKETRLEELQAAYPSLTIAIDEEFDAPETSCITRYTTTVVSNIVCDECYPNLYITEAPKEFEFSKWVKVEGEPAGADVKVGIYFEPLDQFICPDKMIADQLQTMVEPLEVEVSGGELEGTKIGYSYNKNAFPVKRIGRAFRGSGYGVDYMCAEQTGQVRLLGTSIPDGYVEAHLKDMVTKLEPCEQYDAITLKVRRGFYSASFSNRVNEDIRYIFVIPQGTENLFKPFFNTVTAGSKVAGTI